MYLSSINKQQTVADDRNFKKLTKKSLSPEKIKVKTLIEFRGKKIDTQVKSNNHFKRLNRRNYKKKHAFQIRNGLYVNINKNL